MEGQQKETIEQYRLRQAEKQAKENNELIKEVAENTAQAVNALTEQVRECVQQMKEMVTWKVEMEQWKENQEKKFTIDIADFLKKAVVALISIGAGIVMGKMK